MSGRLPARANLEYYRKEAKTLLKALRSGDRAARERICPVLATPLESQPSEIRLSDVQRVCLRLCQPW